MRGHAGRILATATVVFACEVLLVGAVAWSALAESDKASAQSLSLVTDSVVAQTESYIAPARTTAYAAAFAIGSGNLEVEAENLPSILYRHLLRAPQLSSIHVVTPEGMSIEVWRTADGFDSRVVDPLGEGSDTTTVSTDAYVVVSEMATVGGEDPRQTQGYSAGLNSYASEWSSVNVDLDSGTRTASVTEAARNSDGSLVAIAWVDLELTGLDEVLDGIALGSDGGVAVLTEDRTVASAANADELSQGGWFARRYSAEEMGFTTDARLGAGVERSDVGADGALLVQEGSLEIPGGPHWLVQVRASAALLSPGGEALSKILLWLVLGTAAIVIGGAVFTVRLVRPLAELSVRATRDRLTGIPNRAEVERRGPRVIEAALASGGGACVILCDVDNFKLVNDQRGHGAGDEALATVAAALEIELRSTDIAGRWGGDEFIMVLALPPSADPKSVAERIRSRAELELRLVVGHAIPVGLTVGFCHARSAGSTFKEMTNSADAALVAGKRIAKSATYSAL